MEGFGGNARVATERSQGVVKAVGRRLLAVGHAVGAVLGYGNAFGVGPEFFVGGGDPPPPHDQ